MAEGSPFGDAAPAAPVPPAQTRPLPITIVCLVGAIGALVVVPLLFSPSIDLLPSWYPFVLALSAVIGFACMVGLWQMRRWAVYLYTAMCAVTQLLFTATGLWTPRSLIIPAVVIVIMFVYLPRMR